MARKLLAEVPLNDNCASVVFSEPKTGLHLRAFSAITAWEIALLVDTGLVDLDLPVEAWLERFLDRPGVEAVPLGYRVACRSYQLHHLEHRDPADRLLIATAIELACPLVTYDERIARFGKKHGRQYRFAVET